jgi:DNA-binding HxlR family transcriptional regulator
MWSYKIMFRTKAQKKKNCTACPVAKAANLVGDHWVILIVRDLLTGPKRFGGLQESLGGISTRTLTKKLDMLVEAKIATKSHFKETPPRVEYALTKKGEALSDITEALRKYGEKHL